MTRFDDWLLPQPGPGAPDALRLAHSSECDVDVWVDYAAYYGRLAELFERTTEGDEILMAGWEFMLDEELRPGISARKILKEAIGRKVRVRMLASAGSNEGHNRNEVAKARVDGIEAELDEQLAPPTMSHHQKAVYARVSGASHLLVGGMDIALGFHPHRRVGNWFDAQAEVTGHAAELGRLTLEERWASVRREPFTPSFTPGRGNNHTFVQFVRTYAKADEAVKKKGRNYALDGDFSTADLLTRAIPMAKHWIYLEDQFFFEARTNTESVVERLKNAVDGGATLVVVAARPNETGITGTAEARQRLVVDFRSIGHPERVHLLQFKLTPTPQPHFVHTKTWIFDDKLAVVGSANFWTQSMVSESEFGVAIASTLSRPEFPGVPFAHALRIRLWQRLLDAVPGSARFARKPDVKFHEELDVLTKNSPLEPMPGP